MATSKDYFALVPLLGPFLDLFKRNPEAVKRRQDRKDRKQERKQDRKDRKQAARLAARRNK